MPLFESLGLLIRYLETISFVIKLVLTEVSISVGMPISRSCSRPILEAPGCVTCPIFKKPSASVMSGARKDLSIPPLSINKPVGESTAKISESFLFLLLTVASTFDK